MSEYRAILVSREQRDAVKVGADLLDESLSFLAHLPESLIGDAKNRASALGALVERFDAAGSPQPRIRVCVNPSHARPNGWQRPATDERCFAYRDGDPCRVVDAIVVPLEDAGATMAPTSLS